jgi:cation diffusion facilitator CzcD-associated flavoprotein CzcO
MAAPGRPLRAAVIGAGPSGIAAARALIDEGITPVVFEQGDRIGGNWVFRPEVGHSSVYRTTHIISSKTWSAFEDYPMPEDYPDYPSHAQLAAYFEAYARRFGVDRQVRFGCTVIEATPAGEGRWSVRWREGEVEHVETFDALLVANGHHHVPNIPEYPGHFDGEMLHSHAYKEAAPYTGRRVLVVGAGNSACDVAVEVSRVADFVALSVRRGQHILPKFLFGRPGDVNYAKLTWLPWRIRQWLLGLTVRLVQGRYADYGLPEPECGVLEMHPTLNSELLYFIRHGKVHPRPGIARLDGDAVIYTDGRREAFDTLVWATGYRTRFPFLAPEHTPWLDADRVPLYRKMIPADLPGLYFIGLFQPLGCIWPLAEHQGRIAARAICGRWQRPDDLEARIAHEMAHPHYPFLRTRRHATEVDYHRFRKELLVEITSAD